MKTILVLCALVALVHSETYNTRYDDFDAQQLVGNTRLLTSYGHCFLGTGPCTAEGSEFKKNIPEALKTKCAKCTYKQRQIIRTVVSAFKDKIPDIWKQLEEAHDPTGEYRQKFEDFLKATD